MLDTTLHRDPVDTSMQTIWRPQWRADGTPGPQFALLMCPYEEIFFGGARGGGKTAAMLGHWIGHAQKYGAKARGVFFRRVFRQLEEVQRQASDLFPKIGAVYHKGEQVWRFPNGATLRLRHLWDAAGAEAYQGWSLTWICMEELTNWPSLDAMDRMRGTLRSSDGVKCVMLATGNPGGPGHNAVKQRYIDPAPTGYTPIRDPESGEVRVFIPSRLEDNPALTRNDPKYERKLSALGNAQLVKAWRYGDWNVTFGGMLDDLWVPDKHILRPFPIPKAWTMRRSFDWGSARPSSLGMWAISDGSPVKEMGGFTFPRGSVIRWGEWYTVEKDALGNIKPNEGQRLTNQALGRGIAERSRDSQFSGCVADPSIFAEPGRESIYADMQKGAAEVFQKLNFAPANNDRISGWQRLRDLLENAAADVPEKPGLWVFETCTNFLRTVPTLQRDESKPDDVDTDQEDHCLHGDTLVHTEKGVVPIRELVGTEGLAVTVGGLLKRYFDCRMTRRSSECVEVRTSDGRSFISTPDHRVLTQSGWVKATDLLGKVIVTSNDECYCIGIHQEGTHDCHCNQRHNSGIPRNPILSLRQVFSEGWEETSRRCMGILERTRAVRFSCAPQGRGSVEQSAGQPGGPSGRRTPVASHEPAGAGRTVEEEHREGEGGSIGLAWLGRRAGMALKALLGTYRALVRGHGGLRLPELQWRVSGIQAQCQEDQVLLERLQDSPSVPKRQGQRNAGMSSLRRVLHREQVCQDPDMLQSMRSAPTPGALVVSVEPAGNHDVYNLEIEDTHAFAINGGLIVHNCADEVRYLVHSRARKASISGYSIHG